MIAGTATAVSNRVSKRQAERWGAQEMQQTAAAPPAQPAAPPAAAPASGEQSTIEQLKELASLKEQGILTDDEFAAQKAKILG
jgi:hypothetical protein